MRAGHCTHIRHFKEHLSCCQWTRNCEINYALLGRFFLSESGSAGSEWLQAAPFSGCISNLFQRRGFFLILCVINSNLNSTLNLILCVMNIIILAATVANSCDMIDFIASFPFFLTKTMKLFLTKKISNRACIFDKYLFSMSNNADSTSGTHLFPALLLTSCFQNFRFHWVTAYPLRLQYWQDVMRWKSYNKSCWKGYHYTFSDTDENKSSRSSFNGNFCPLQLLIFSKRFRPKGNITDNKSRICMEICRFSPEIFAILQKNCFFLGDLEILFERSNKLVEQDK